VKKCRQLLDPQRLAAFYPTAALYPTLRLLIAGATNKQLARQCLPALPAE